MKFINFSPSEREFIMELMDQKIQTHSHPEYGKEGRQDAYLIKGVLWQNLLTERQAFTIHHEIEYYEERKLHPFASKSFKALLSCLKEKLVSTFERE